MNVDEDVCKDSRTHAKTLLMFTVCLAISWELHKVVIILHCLLGFGGNTLFVVAGFVV